jgi:hypothetical protein
MEIKDKTVERWIAIGPSLLGSAEALSYVLFGFE